MRSRSRPPAVVGERGGVLAGRGPLTTNCPDWLKVVAVSENCGGVAWDGQVAGLWPRDWGGPQASPNARIASQIVGRWGTEWAGLPV